MEKIVTESNGFRLSLGNIKDEKIILSIENSHPFVGKRSITMTKRQVLKLINELQEIIKND